MNELGTGIEEAIGDAIGEQGPFYGQYDIQKKIFDARFLWVSRTKITLSREGSARRWRMRWRRIERGKP